MSNIDRGKAKQFSQRVRALRLKRGMQSQVIAEKAGIARSTYAGYETQDRFPPIETLTKLAEILNTSTDYLVGLTDDPEPKELTRNINDYLKNMDRLNWNGVPLSNDELRPLRDLFEVIVRERLPKIEEETDEEKNGTN